MLENLPEKCPLIHSLFRNSNPPSKTPLPIFRQSAPLKTFLDPLSPSLSGNVSCGCHSPMKNKILKFNFCFYNIIKKHKIKSTKLNLFLITKFINAGQISYHVPYFNLYSLSTHTRINNMSFLGKKSYGKINEKYQSPPSEKTSTPFELLLPPKNQNSANSPPFC